MRAAAAQKWQRGSGWAEIGASHATRLPPCCVGVSLAMVSAAYGCRCFIAMPDDAAIEKAQMLQALGAAG